jgi:hypothetical protein
MQIYARPVRSETRREMAQIYGEMYESGYNPSRGLTPLMVAIVLCTLLGLAGLLLLPSLGWGVFQSWVWERLSHMLP